jgi:hypothetical protein
MLRQTFISTSQKAALRNDLVRLLSQLPEDENIAPAVPPPSVAAVTQKIPDTPRMKAIKNKARAGHKVRSDLKSRLLVRSLDEPEKYTDADRLELAREIMEENVPMLDELHDQIRRFEDDGIEPADDAEMIKAQAVADMKKVYSLRPQISRLKKSVANGDKEAAKELSEKIAELEALEQSLRL